MQHAYTSGNSCTKVLYTVPPHIIHKYIIQLRNACSSTFGTVIWCHFEACFVKLYVIWCSREWMISEHRHRLSAYTHTLWHAKWNLTEHHFIRAFSPSHSFNMRHWKSILYFEHWWQNLFRSEVYSVWDGGGEGARSFVELNIVFRNDNMVSMCVSVSVCVTQTSLQPQSIHKRLTNSILSILLNRLCALSTSCRSLFLSFLAFLAKFLVVQNEHNIIMSVVRMCWFFFCLPRSIWDVNCFRWSFVPIEHVYSLTIHCMYVN